MLFVVKCMFIFYFAACTRFEQLTDIRSATPLITKGAWKIEFNNKGKNDKPASLVGYKLVFGSTGILKATKNGMEIDGNWSEDNISKRITIDFGNTDPVLAKLNDYWNIRDIADLELNLQNAHKTSLEGFKLLHYN